MGNDDDSYGNEMRDQQEELDRLKDEELRKNKLTQKRTLSNIRTAAGGGSGFGEDRDTLG